MQNQQYDLNHSYNVFKIDKDHVKTGRILTRAEQKAREFNNMDEFQRRRETIYRYQK